MAIQKNAGLMMDNPVQRFLRDGRLFKIPEGTSEIQHLVIARRIGSFRRKEMNFRIIG